MTRAIVFGGSGFIGSYVADQLSQRGYDVVVANIRETPYPNADQTFVRCDIMEPDAVNDVIAGAEFVFNFAGLADLDESIHEPRLTMQLNVLGNVHLLEAARTHGVRRFVYASSAYAFSPKGSFYGISKLTSEKLVEEYAERFGLPYTIIRYGSVYGERADHHNGMYRLLRQAIENGEIRHQGSGEEVREYIHAADAAKLSVDVIEDDKFAGEHVILTGVERLKIKDLMHMIREIMSDRISVTHTNEQYDGHYTVTPYSFDPNMAKKLVPNPYIDMGQGLVSCIRHIHEELHPSTD